MTRRLAAALAVVLATLTLAPVTAHAADGPTRVMIVGDSVTQGYRGDVTWRYFLWHALRDAGDSVDFVGPRKGPFYLHPDGQYDWDYRGEDAYADADFDQDHGAWYGGRLGQHNNWFYVPFAPQVQEQQPDVIVSMWGINDLSDDDQGPAELIASYRAWIAEARSVKPDVDFVIGRLSQTWLYDGEVTAFNALLGDLAVELSTDASRILVATMTEPYSPEADTFDRIHPNLSGQAKIAGMVGAPLHALLTGSAGPYAPVTVSPSPVTTVPTPPPVAIAPQPQQKSPRPPRRIRATRHDARVKVTWQRVRWAEAYRVRCGAQRTTVSGRRTFLRASSRSCAVRSLGGGGSSAWKKVRVRTAPRAG